MSVQLNNSSSMRRIKSTPSITKAPPNGRALLMEDSGLQRKMEKKIIERLNYECDEASTLRQAINLLEKNKYDCVVTDHNVNNEEAAEAPEKEYVQQLTRLLFPKGKPIGCEEGILLLEYIKQNIKDQKPNQVLISAFDGSAGDTHSKNIIAAAHARGAHFLSKPFRGDKLAPLLTSPYIAPPGETNSTSSSSSSSGNILPRETGSGSTPSLPPSEEMKRSSRIQEGDEGEGGNYPPTPSTRISELNNPFAALMLRSYSAPTPPSGTGDINKGERKHGESSTEGPARAEGEVSSNKSSPSGKAPVADKGTPSVSTGASAPAQKDSSDTKENRRQ